MYTMQSNFWIGMAFIINTAIHTTLDVLHITNGVIYVLSLFLLSIRLIICMKLCYRMAISYRASKRTPLLHPIHRDVQYLSLQRKLYNLKTQSIKYILICMCLCVEISQIASIFVYIFFNTGHFRDETTSSNNFSCIRTSYFANIYESSFLIPVQNSPFINHLLFSTLLSILTRYLAARYLKHSFKRTLTKYLLWLIIQFIIVTLSSTLYTFILSFILFPLLLIINWLVLFRDSRILSRVLRSNLIELEFHSGNKVLYREQLIAYKSYRIFVNTLIFSQFLLVVAGILFLLVKLFILICFSNCILYYIYGYSLHVPTLGSQKELIRRIGDLIVNISLTLYLISNILPLICVSLLPLIKRYKSRNNVYRFNYENITRPLLAT